MSFSVSVWEPFKSYVVQKGEMEQSKIIETFEQMPWAKWLEKMAGKKPAEIYYSPSIEILNIDNKTTLTMSAVGAPDNYTYFIFYKRPKKVKQFLGLSEKLKEKYVSEIKNQTLADAMNCLHAFIKNDVEFLESKMI